MSSNCPSKIFGAHRVLGVVSNHVPSVIRYIQRRQEYLICTVVGKSFHTYGSGKLRLLTVSGTHPNDISCLACDKYLVFTGCENVIRAWRRGNELKHTYSGHDRKVHSLLPLGPYLISVDEGNNIKIWFIKTEELVLELGFDDATFRITSLMHPSTYLNKILLGSQQGRLQLWNIHTSKLIYTFRGWNSAVLVIEQAPAVDVVAIGLESGAIYIHNLKYDETVIKFTQEWGPVNAISFRSDGEPIMATSTTVGHICLWNMEKKELVCLVRNAHHGTVSALNFLSSEPVLISSSVDNSLKVWLFDQPDGGGHLLRFRDGHHAPPSRIQFHGSDGTILSAGQDSTLRMFSATIDTLNKSLGVASFNRKAAIKKGVHKDKRKMPPIIEFASGTTREKEWDNIVCCHHGMGKISTWSSHLAKMGKHLLLHERFKKDLAFKRSCAVCVAISTCGNFLLVGYDSGHADMFNIQSGIFRGQYGSPKAHEMGVCGITSDMLNQQTITGSNDSTLKFWHFKNKNLLETIKLTAGVTQVLLHRSSGLLAVALEDFTITLVDIVTRKVARNFTGYLNRITDMAFSSDSRLLVTSSMDCSIKTWDIPSSSLVDHFLVESACTSLDFSPSSDYLISAHVDDLAIHMWYNRTLYTNVSLRPLPSDYEPQLITTDAVTTPIDNEEDDKMVIADDEYKSMEQISDELVTLSLIPHSRWHNLLVLDVIKAKNKPKQPVQKPKQAPFFLPTIPGLEFKFAETEKPSKSTETKVVSTGFEIFSPFAEELAGAKDKCDYDAIMSSLKEMGPSRVDMELRCLTPDNGGSTSLILRFLNVIVHVLEENKDFEAAQAYLALFLKLHWDSLSTDATVVERINELEAIQRRSWERLKKEFDQCLCLVNFFKNPVL